MSPLISTRSYPQLQRQPPRLAAQHQAGGLVENEPHSALGAVAGDEDDELSIKLHTGGDGVNLNAGICYGDPMPRRCNASVFALCGLGTGHWRKQPRKRDGPFRARLRAA